VYDPLGVELIYHKEGQVRAGEPNLFEVDGASLPAGIYYARLLTGDTTKTLRLVLEK
jgi:hypothetical protein